MLLPTLLAVPLLSGCAYDENLPEIDIVGKVVLPREALTRTIVSPVDPNAAEVTYAESVEPVLDTRLIGPVYLGAYSGIDTVSFSYPHPTMGPVVTTTEPGDTFPYGGTTVGRLDFACYEAIACKVTTGRMTDYADLLDYFKNVLGKPVRDKHGLEVDDASVFQQFCYEYFDATSEEEMSFIGAEDFVENADGDFEAEFLMPHTVYSEGMVLWGWMDAPKVGIENDGSFSTCDETGAGRQNIEYDQDFREGRPHTDLLNSPSYYIYEGDWTGDGLTIMDSPEANPVVNLNVYIPEVE